MFESLRANLFAPKGLKFNSQICTTREQSGRLIALGLKKETADMMWWSHTVDWCGIINETERQWHLGIGYAEPLDARMERIPAWSLHRLIELKQPNTKDNAVVILSREQTYDKLIGMIAKSIKEGYFNKEYLV